MTKTKRYLKILASILPTRLPIGMTEFNVWSQDIIDTFSSAGLLDNDSTKWALAAMVMNLGSTRAFVPKLYFGLAVVKAMSNQVASTFMYELKEKQKAEASAAKLAEDTAQQAAATSEQTQANPA